VCRRALPLSSIIQGYADISLDLSDSGEGEGEGEATIFDWDGDDELGIDPSDPTEANVIDGEMCLVRR
jgi:hypothetical protein